MATIQNDRDIVLQATSPRLLSYSFGTTGTFLGDSTGTLAGTPVSTVVNAALAPNGDITEQILENSGTVITVNSSTLFQSLGTGSAGVFIGSGGLFGKNSAGSTTFSIDASNGNATFSGSLNAATGTFSGSLNAATGTFSGSLSAATGTFSGSLSAATGTFSGSLSAATGTFNGNITGTANINISGQAIFNGAYSYGGATSAVLANTSLSSVYGINAYSDSAFGGAAVRGQSSNGASGVQGYSTTSPGIGVLAQNFVPGGTALAVAGNMTITSTSLVSNLNADMLDGYHANQFCSIVPTDSGTCTVAGQGFSIFVAITGYRSRGTGNIVYIEPTSDRRLKQDINPENYGLNFINNLIPVQYKLKANPKIIYHGFIAQDLQPLVQENDALFQTHDDGTVGTDYNSLIAPLVKAVQELSIELNSVKQELKSIKHNTRSNNA